MTRRGLVVVVVGVIGARAAAADTGVVIESYTGARPDNAGRLLGPVLEELTTRGFTVGYDGIGRKFEGEVSRSARTAAGMPGDFSDSVDSGHKAWIAGRYDEAVAILSPLIETAHGNAAAVSQDSKLRNEVKSALLDLALAQQRIGDATAAGEAMGELLRAFPEVVITKPANGPEAFALYEATKKKLGTKGTLVVEVVDSATQVFIDEHYEKNGTVRKTELYPGTYRVYAAKGDLEGRTYVVTVTAGGEATVTIDIGLDSVLHIDPSWTGLSFTSGDDRDKLEGQYAAAFAKLASAGGVAVVGIDTVRGHPALVGSLISLTTGREIRYAALAIEPEPSSDRRRALARYLAGDDAAASSLDTVERGGSGGSDTGSGTGTGAGHDTGGGGGGSRWGILKYLTTGVGLAAGGVGAYLLIKNGSCKTDADPCPEVYNTATPGWILAGSGAALVGLGIYMFVTDHTPSHGVAIAPTDGGAMAIVTGSF